MSAILTTGITACDTSFGTITGGASVSDSVSRGPFARGPFVPGASDETSLVRRPFDASKIPPAPPLEAIESVEDYKEIISAVEEQGASMFIDVPPPQVMHELELVYLTTGKVFELAEMYKSVVDSEGDGHPMAARLAFLYARVGQQTAAERMSTKAADARPDDPFAWFVRGFSLGQRPSPDTKILQEIEQAFSRVLALDREFRMPGGIQAEQIREQRDALRERIEVESPQEHLQPESPD